MESHRNLRVLPSNAPILESDNLHRSPSGNPGLHSSHQTCSKFNNGIDCKVCDLLHACSTCLQEGHDAQACKKGILRISSGNIGSSELLSNSKDYNNDSSVHYTSKASHTFLKEPEYKSRNALKLEHRRMQKLLDPLSRLPLSYRSELLSPRYNAYRAKARTKAIWPDHIEEAFQEGTCTSGLQPILYLSNLNSITTVPLPRSEKTDAQGETERWQ